MKIITKLSISLVLVVVFSSCRKEVDIDIIQTKTSAPLKVKTYTEEITNKGVQAVTTFRLDYDFNGRLIKLVSLSNTGDKFVYKYNTNAYSTELYYSDELVMQQISFINSLMLIDSTVKYYNNDQALTEKYVYNSGGKLILLNQYDYKKTTGSSLYNYHQYSYDKYGNVNRDADISSVTTYDYYPDLNCNFVIGAPYIQKPEKLVKTTTYSIGGVTEIFNHTYTFDSLERLSTEKITKTGSSDLLIRKYTY
jgi:hypothetical protein